MKKNLVLSALAFLLVCTTLQAQNSNKTGNWTDGGVWDGGVAPATTNISSTVIIQSGSRITRYGNLSSYNFV